LCWVFTLLALYPCPIIESRSNPYYCLLISYLQSIMSQASISSSQHQYDSRHADLMKACVSGRVAQVRQLFSTSSVSGSLTLPWSTTADKDTLRLALQRACGRGNIEIVNLLLAQGAEIEPKYDKKGGEEVGALFRAAENGFTNIVEQLLSKGAKPDNARDRFGRMALTVAALSGHLETVQALLKAGANPDARDRDGRSTLVYLAAEKSYGPSKPKEEKQKGPKSYNLNEKVLSALVAADADLDAKDTSHRTALIWAAVNGKYEFVKFLLEGIGERRVVVDACNDKGRTALHFAAESNFESIVELLLKNHAHPRIASEGSWTALHNAAQKGHAGIVAKLLAAGASANAELSNGKTALHWAAQNGHKEVVGLLLKQGDTRLFVKDSFERTPIICAAENGHDEIVQMLSPGQTGHRLSPAAKIACDNFKATIVDFGLERQARGQTQRVLERSMYELLYEWDPVHKKDKIPSQIKNMKDKPAFRWIHIPHNNVAWVEAMLTKAFVESGHREISEFKALEKCFGQEHRGSTAHSSFMRTFAHRIPPVDYRQPVVTSSSVGMSSPTEVIQEEDPLAAVPTPAIHLDTGTPLQGSLDMLEKENAPTPITPSGKKGKKGGEKWEKGVKRTEKGDMSKKPEKGEMKKQGNGPGKNAPNKKQSDKKDLSKTPSKQTNPSGKIVLFVSQLSFIPIPLTLMLDALSTLRKRLISIKNDKGNRSSFKT
jgi:ankyrin repeat protein